MYVAEPSILAVTPWEAMLLVVGVMYVLMFLWALVAMGQSRRVGINERLGYLVLILAFPVIGWVMALLTLRRRNRENLGPGGVPLGEVRADER